MEKAITAISLRKTYSAEVWRARVASCRSSGLNVKTWCGENGINTHTYYRWERKLLSETDGKRQSAITGRFAELPIACATDSDAVVAMIRAKGIQCEIRGGISKDILSVLVEALSDHA